MVLTANAWICVFWRSYHKASEFNCLMSAAVLLFFFACLCRMRASDKNGGILFLDCLPVLVFELWVVGFVGLSKRRYVPQCLT